MLRRYRQNTRGVTLLELLVVVTIIMILALMSLPNIPPIIASHRIRSSANDLLTKVRSVRSVTISKRRQLDMTIDTTEHLLKVEKPKHTEYDLLKDIALAISTSSETYPNLSSFILFEEDAQTLEEIHIGDKKQNGIDLMQTDCPGNKVSFNPSGTIQTTCTITITNNRINKQYQLTLYKGGQIVLE